MYWIQFKLNMLSSEIHIYPFIMWFRPHPLNILINKQKSIDLKNSVNGVNIVELLLFIVTFGILFSCLGLPSLFQREMWDRSTYNEVGYIVQISYPCQSSWVYIRSGYIVQISYPC